MSVCCIVESKRKTLTCATSLSLGDFQLRGGVSVLTVAGVRAFIIKVPTFFFSVFSGFIVAFSNFLQGELAGRSALETGSKWEEEPLIEFLG